MPSKLCSWDILVYDFQYASTELLVYQRAGELHVIIYQIVAKLYDYGFKIDFIMQDGGEENRHFVNSHFPDEPETFRYQTKNPVTLEPLLLIQDFSHNIKKLRNSL